MKELIKIESKKGVNTVNARDLWLFLESKQEFSNWIKKRVSEYEFSLNEDYTTVDKKINRQILKEYHLSIDMAKELAMVERNDRGREARKYFIACEKKLFKTTEKTTWQIEREKGKEIRNDLTFMLTKLTVYAHEQESKTQVHTFITTYTRMLNSILFLSKGVKKPGKFRDKLTKAQLSRLTLAETVACETIETEMNEGIFTKIFLKMYKVRFKE